MLRVFFPLSKPFMIQIFEAHSRTGDAIPSFRCGLKYVHAEFCEHGLAEFLHRQMAKAGNDVMVDEG